MLVNFSIPVHRIGFRVASKVGQAVLERSLVASDHELLTYSPSSGFGEEAVSHEVRIRFEWTPQLLADALSKFRPQRSAVALLASSIVFLALLPLALWFVFEPVGNWSEWFVSAVLVFPIGIACLAMRTFSASELGGDLAELRDSERQISYLINRDGWRMETANRQTQTAWRHYQRGRVIRMDGGFSVLESGQETSVGLVHWFPDSAFESDSATDKFVRLVEEAGVKFEDRRSRSN